MKILVLLAITIPALSSAQGLSLTPPWVTGGGQVLWSAPFSAPGCYATGSTAGASSAISITRATPATVALTSDPSVLTTCASGEFRVGYEGLVTEGQKINYALQSNTMSTSTAATSPWTLSNATVATVADAPMGGTWAEVTSTTSAGVMFTGTNPAATATPVTSVWMAKASGTGAAGVYFYSTGAITVTACTCVRSDGGTCAANITDSNKRCLASVSDLGTTPIRLSAIATLSGTVTSNSAMGVAPGVLGTSTGTTRFSGAMLESGSAPSSLIVTTTGAITRNADATSATVPAVPSKGWCISGNWKPTSGTWPNALSLWTLGDTYNAANRASSWGNSALYIVDAASGVKDLGDFASDPVSPWKIVTCNVGGSLSLAVNGVLVDSTSTGAGTGILTTPATTLHLGAQANAGTISDWYIRDLKVWAAKSTKEASK